MIQMRRMNLTTVATEIRKTEIIGQNNQHIGRCCGGGGQREKGQQQHREGEVQKWFHE